MSSYIKKLKNPKTGKMQKVFCIDNYFWVFIKAEEEGFWLLIAHKMMSKMCNKSD